MHRHHIELCNCKDRRWDRTTSVTDKLPVQQMPKDWASMSSDMKGWRTRLVVCLWVSAPYWTWVGVCACMYWCVGVEGHSMKPLSTHKHSCHVHTPGDLQPCPPPQLPICQADLHTRAGFFIFWSANSGWNPHVLITPTCCLHNTHIHTHTHTGDSDKIENPLLNLQRPQL